MEAKNTTSERTNTVLSPKYIILEDGICYDWDDYYTWGAVIYDTDKKEVFTEQYGHGCGPQWTAENSINIQDITGDGIKLEIAQACYDKFAEYFGSMIGYSLTHNFGNMSIPCEVKRSRLFKGKAIAFHSCAQINNYRPYYGRAFDDKYDYYIMVYSPELNKVVRVGNSCVSLDGDTVKSIVDAVAKEVVTLENLDSLIHLFAYNMSYSSCDKDNLRYSVQRMIGDKVHKYAGEFEVPADASNPQQEKKDAKKAAFKAEKMPQLLEWAKNKLGTEATEEEIQALAERVWVKHYA